ncbi:MAG: Fe-S-containing hydro-lyase [Clostridiales bacterium]|nr:Fe-S-containing hydro-lyase [Clostridiales bacterium]
MEKVIIETPLTEEKVSRLKCGDMVLITGTIYTARDAAHQRMMKSLTENKELPIDLQDAIIYYAGPTPARPGNVSGSFGPTTSSRMDKMTTPLLDKGLKGMIGKGLRSFEVIESIKKNNAVYFAAIGGAGALISNAIKKIEVIAYDDLGTEAVRKLYVEKFPVVVAIDCYGNNIYEKGIQTYKTE